MRHLVRWLQRITLLVVGLATVGLTGWLLSRHSGNLVPQAAAEVVHRTEIIAPPSSQGQPAHFHHVHLNVTDRARTIQFYERFFGANRVRYRDLSDGLFTEKSFILLNVVAQEPPSNLGTSLWHIGWAGVDGASEFEWRRAAGIGVQTPITPLGNNFYMYFWGPDRELIEVYTGSRNHRFEHVHLLATDVDATVRWFADHLGLTPGRTSQALGTTMNTIRVDNVNLIVFAMPPRNEPPPDWLPAGVWDNYPGVTEGTAIDHIAFAYTDIRPVLERLRTAGVDIVRPIATSEEFGLTSFFVRGPDGLLVEIVQEKPIPEGIWR
jgi:catechol 2,3-dioxygenase-like lactoylglutathione lyase family enzyme